MVERVAGEEVVKVAYCPGRWYINEQNELEILTQEGRNIIW